MIKPTQAPLTRESIERDHPALFSQLRTEFIALGANAARARIQASQTDARLTTEPSKAPSHFRALEPGAAHARSLVAQRRIGTDGSATSSALNRKRRHDLDAKAKAYMNDHPETDYVAAVKAVQGAIAAPR